MSLHASPRPLLQKLLGSLNTAERAALGTAITWAATAGAGLYCVGGSVRDLLLDRPHQDFDLAVDGDAAALATAIAGRLETTATIHAQFGTASIAGASCTIDVARTRSEIYAYPGALPVVSRAAISEDLARRDFSIHAMAIRLSGADPGELLDPFDGQADLEARLIRLLHDQSFRDDPTRILRLARYAARLSFGIERETAMLAHRDATFLGATSPARVTHELERTFNEPFPERSLLRLRDLRALSAFYPAFRVSDSLADGYDRLRRDGGDRPGMAAYLATTAAPWPRSAIQGLAQVLELRADGITALRELPETLTALTTLASERPDPVAVVQRLSALPLPAVRGAGAALGGVPGELASQFVREWRHVRPILGGSDILALGIPAGPAVGRILEALRAARLRNQLADVEEERALVRTWQRSHHAERDSSTT